MRSLDQTGLAQKGGAVVSDVRLSRAGPGTSNKLATDIAALPDLVRGYEDVELASVETYHERPEELRTQFENQTPPVA